MPTNRWQTITLLSVVCASCLNSIEVGDAVPNYLLTCEHASGHCTTADRVVVVWLFKREDCLSCMRFPAALRAAQKNAGAGSFSFVAVLVSDSSTPPDWLPRYFMKERLTPTIHVVEQHELHQDLGNLTLPTLLVVVDGSVHAMSDGDPEILTDLPELIEGRRDDRGS